MATKPIILFVDDEPQVLNAIERDLRAHYRGEVRIIKAGSGAEALETVKKLKERNAPLALLLSDQRMPGMEGTKFLAEAIKYYPDARKVLLTAYADTQAAIDSINSIGLDHYLMKPWDPPDQNLYPVLDDLLEEWTANVELPYEGIRVMGTMWSRPTHEVKDFLALNRVPYQYVDLDLDEAARALVSDMDALQRLPVILFPDGSSLVDPDRNALAARIGMTTETTAEFYDLVVIGGGPAGLAAAVYGASEGLTTILLERTAIGGQAGTSSRIENYVGFPKGLSGAELARRATAQAQRLGAELVYPQEVCGIRLDADIKVITLANGKEISCRALVLATGMAVRELQVPGVADLSGAGVYYGASLTEAAHFRGRPVFVVGGANSAGQGAMWFARYASQVTLLVRGSGLEASMSRYLIDRIDAAPNMDVWTHTEVIEAQGDKRLERLQLKNNQTGETWWVDAAAMFIFIGSRPHSDLARELVALDPGGFVLTGSDIAASAGGRPSGWRLKRDPLPLETSVPGIFAAGDVRAGSSKRVAAATGEGAVAVRFVHQYLATV